MPLLVGKVWRALLAESGKQGQFINLKTFKSSSKDTEGFLKCQPQPQPQNKREKSKYIEFL